MKKFICLFFIAALAALNTSCENSNSTSSDTSEIDCDEHPDDPLCTIDDGIEIQESPEETIE